MTFLHRFRHLFLRRRSETEMADEMRFHLERRSEEYVDDGLSSEDARFAAQRKFGNVASIQEQAREDRGWAWFDRFGKDLRLAVRRLSKAPGFAIVAILTLGLGVGANTSMFSILNTVLLKPLPYPGDDHLDAIFRATRQDPEGGVSPADFLDAQHDLNRYGEIAAYIPGEVSLAERGLPAEMAPVCRVSANLFSVLRVGPQMGRDFRPQEEMRGNDRVVILSQRCWLNRFGGRADIIGRSIRLDGERHEIIGVMPASFNDWRHLGWVDIFRPLGFTAEQLTDRSSLSCRVVGRRSEGTALAEAQHILGGFAQRLANEFPAVNAGSTWRGESLNALAAGRMGIVILPMLTGLSGFVLLIACSNLANLLLARTMARARELAVRSALGASRLQLLRPLIAESLLMAVLGGACAILVARWIRDWMSMRSTADNGEQMVIDLDWRVLTWVLVVSGIAAFAFGLAPALFAMRLNTNETLKSGARGATGGPGHRRFRQMLIIGQFALAMVLLAGAALYIRGLDDLNNRRAGWESERLVTASISLPSANYPSAEKINAFHRLAVERLEALPGVASASIAFRMPFFNWYDTRKYVVAGRELPEAGHEPSAVVNEVTSHYFEAVGSRILAGRGFTDHDDLNSPKVVIISQSMATGLFGKGNPLGQRVAQVGTKTPQWAEIVGVVADVRSVFIDFRPAAFQIYQPMAQEPVARAEFAIRTTDSASLAPTDAIRRAMAELDPDLPVRGLQSAEDKIYRSNYQLRVLRDLLSGMAILGLGLACLGVYGVIARTMAERTPEFAIRFALGASMRDVTRMVLASGAKLALVGSSIGLVGALGVSRLIANGMPGMHFNSPTALGGTMVLLVAIALLACWLPARRAGKVDAMLVLRSD